MPAEYQQRLDEMLVAPVTYGTGLYEATREDAFGLNLGSTEADLRRRVGLFQKVVAEPITIDVGFGPTEPTLHPYELWLYYIPLAESLLAASMVQDKRCLVAVSGPPGSTKSYKTATLHAVMQRLCGGLSDYVEWVPFDGFHFPNSYLDNHFIHEDGETLGAHPALGSLPVDDDGFYLEDGSKVPLRQIKGMAPTFDVKLARQNYSTFHKQDADLSFPVYSRELHDPVSDGKLVSSSVQVLLTEGNFLFLGEGRYKGMQRLFDLNIFLDSDAGDNQGRCYSRHHAGGKTDDEIAKVWEWMDGPNQEIVNATADSANIRIEVDSDGAISGVRFV